jgi:glutathione synthase/RimK-type ligase-like ATP-grasp enzyme
MNSVLIIIDSPELWAPYYYTESVITSIQYLQNEELSQRPQLIINLCSDLSYNSDGYYCSLLAQARGHRVIPSVETLSKFDSASPLTINCAAGLFSRHDSASVHEERCSHQIDLFFGKCEDPRYERFSRYIFDQYPCPLLRICFSGKQHEQVTGIRPLSLADLNDHQQDLFATHLDLFNKKIWRQPRKKKPARYDLAILYDPGELFPPSNRGALNRFVSEAKKMNVNAELITEKDATRLMEFDALFIRQTTAVNHITYQLAQKAQQADMVVMDDPASIICCTNKVYLKELMDKSAIPAPKSLLLFRAKLPSYQEMAEYLGQTMVMKIPDGSFSIGVSLVSSEKEYLTLQEDLFKRSSILLVQEFIPTEFDWRIGMLNGECIYACKYFMARGHWQIYQHKEGTPTKSGGFETVPVNLVPRQVTRIAKKVSAIIGKGLYGVDIKYSGDKAIVIEVNDNPSIDHGVEDKVLGDELYRAVLREFISRLNTKRRA